MLVSARFWKGNELDVMSMCRSGHIISITSPGIMDELVDVLMDKFHENVSDIDTYRDEVALCSEIVFPTGELDVLADDPSDNMVIETAILGNADLIVTGDKHLLSLGSFQGISILRAPELVRLTSSR